MKKVIKNREIEYAVVVEEDPNGGFACIVPSLPGCASEGRTLEEALKNVRQAITLYLEVLAERGKKIPTAPVTSLVNLRVPVISYPHAVGQAA